ncbi:MAG: hypothetical protein NZO16_07500 [Deltaproteobacteria bacterium]|nr:hypothetical protein [Deltaproteobacteria bacterium]
MTIWENNVIQLIKMRSEPVYKQSQVLREINPSVKCDLLYSTVDTIENWAVAGGNLVYTHSNGAGTFLRLIDLTQPRKPSQIIKLGRGPLNRVVKCGSEFVIFAQESLEISTIYRLRENGDLEFFSITPEFLGSHPMIIDGNLLLYQKQRFFQFRDGEVHEISLFQDLARYRYFGHNQNIAYFGLVGAELLAVKPFEGTFQRIRETYFKTPLVFEGGIAYSVSPAPSLDVHPQNFEAVLNDGTKIDLGFYQCMDVDANKRGCIFLVRTEEGLLKVVEHQILGENSIKELMSVNQAVGKCIKRYGFSGYEDGVVIPAPCNQGVGFYYLKSE